MLVKFLLILSSILLFSCASKPRANYVAIKTISTMNGTIEVEMVPTKNISCMGRDGNLVNSCESKNGTKYYKIGLRKEASAHIYKLAVEKCNGHQADRIGERISREYSGNSGVSCYSNGSSTSCSGTNTNYTSGYISTWRCQTVGSI
jgi:hypothetical protein